MAYPIDVRLGQQHYLDFQEDQLPIYNSKPGNVTLSVSNSYAIVQAAIKRAQTRLFEDNFVPWRFHPRNSNFEPATNSTRTYVSGITIRQSATDPVGVNKPLAGAVNESYTLSISRDGAVKITAVSSVGILRALETFTQLFYQHSSDAGVYTPRAPVYISDAPKFSHRGLNLDVARSYFAPSDVMRTIDALSWNKFNRLHLHATDAQTWPLDIPALPNLSKNGAYHPGLSYTPEELREIQAYGTARGIEVIIEIDMPGHTSSIGLTFPELITGLNIQPDWSTYANEPPSGGLKLNSSVVYAFLHTLWEDLLPRLAPYSAYFHTGGDEINENVYLFDETVKSNDTAVIQPLLQKFVDFNHGYARAAGLTPIVWEEMLLEWNLTLGSDVVVQTWLSDDAVLQSVSKGFKTLVGNYNKWYLDCGRGAWIDSLPTTASSAYPFNDYCSPTKNWRLIYSYDPLSGIPSNLSHLVLGGEVHMWTEQTDPINLDNIVWPRASAAAEVLWSGAKDEAGQNRSQIEASKRLGEMRERMVRRGVRSAPVQMAWCQQNGTQCAL
ncbi:MAG: hypothetical protein Q9214_003330 [Letrouitia sp. 1 TL-2023]